MDSEIGGTEYDPAAIRLDHFRQSESESEDEHEEERNLALQKQLQELTYSSSEDDCNESLQSNNDYISNNHRDLQDKFITSGGEHNVNSKYVKENLPLADIQGLPKEYSVDHSNFRFDYRGNNHSEVSVWSDESNNSGNFIGEKSLIKSPSRFHIEINSSGSQNSLSSQIQYDYSGSENNKQPVLSKPYNHVLSQENCSSSEWQQQFHLLYESRGREIDRLSDELNNVKRQLTLKTQSLEQQLHIVRNEKEDLLTSQTQMNILLSEYEEKIRNFTEDLHEKETALESLKSENKRLLDKQDIAEGTISSLENQVKEMQTFDGLSRSREAHEHFVKKLQNSHRSELEEVKHKLKSSKSRENELELQLRSMENDMKSMRNSRKISIQEMDEINQQLKHKLETTQQQLEILLSSKDMVSPQLVQSVQEECKKVKNDYDTLEQRNKLNEQELEHYDMLVKLNLFELSAGFPNSQDSISELNLGQLGIKSRNSKDCAGQNENHNHQSSDINSKIKEELLKSLYCNKQYRDEIRKFTAALSSKEKEYENKIKSLEMNKNQNDSKTSKELLLLKDNSYQKNQLASYIKNYSLLKTSLDEVKEALATISRNRHNVDKDIVIVNAVNEFDKAVREISNFQMQSWEKLKQENIQLFSKRYSCLDSFAKIIQSLNDIKTEFDKSGKLDFLAFKHLLETFNSNVVEIKDEMQHTLSENAEKQNEFWSLQIEFEKINEENIKLNKENKKLSEDFKSLEENFNLDMEKCKNDYLRFHEKTLVSMKEQIESQYNDLISSLKENINNLEDKLTETQSNYLTMCKDKNVVEEKLVTLKNSIHKSDSLEFDSNLYKENEEMKGVIKSLNEEIYKQEELRKKFESLHMQRNKNSLKDVDGDFLQEKEKILEEKAQAESYYKNEIKNLKDQIVALAHQNMSIISEAKKSLESEYMETLKSYTNRISELITNIEKLENEKAVMIHVNEKNIAHLMKENGTVKEKYQEISYTYEMKFKQQNKEHEMMTHNFEEQIHSLKLDSLKNQETRLKLENENKEYWDKYMRYKKLYLKADNLRISQKEKFKENNQMQDLRINIIKTWLEKARPILISSVNDLIDNLQENSKRVPSFDSKPHVELVSHIKDALEKLIIEEITESK